MGLPVESGISRYPSAMAMPVPECVKEPRVRKRWRELAVQWNLRYRDPVRAELS